MQISTKPVGIEAATGHIARAIRETQDEHRDVSRPPHKGVRCGAFRWQAHETISRPHASRA
jgi:hypothetical protein